MDLLQKTFNFKIHKVEETLSMWRSCIEKETDLMFQVKDYQNWTTNIQFPPQIENIGFY